MTIPNNILISSLLLSSYVAGSIVLFTPLLSCSLEASGSRIKSIQQGYFTNMIISFGGLFVKEIVYLNDMPIWQV